MTRTAVYRFYDSENVLLYVGASGSPEKRWHGHAAKPWWPDVKRNSMTWYPTKQEALAAETDAIQDEHPKHNIVHKSSPGGPSKMELIEVGEAYRSSREALRETMQESRVLASEAADLGVSQHRIAELLGVDRMTVRKWVGKR